MGKDLSKDQRFELQQLLQEFFSILAVQPGKTSLISHQIPTMDCAPIRQRPYRIPHAYREEVMKELDEMERSGVIKESDSPWAAPMV